MPDQIITAIKDMAAGMGSSERILGFMEGVKYAMEVVKAASAAKAEGETA